jgi:secreted PhoX family phosphatase
MGDILSTAQLQLHTPGTSYPIKWVTIATPPKDNATSLGSATALAKAAGATPFKRPGNMAWLPGSKFRTFFFTPTGDTDAPTSQVPELAARGSWGSIFRVDLGNDGNDVKKDEGTISLFFLGDQTHNSFDNINFINENQLLVAEDRGDLLHDQLNTLDSVWAFDVRNKNAAPIRFIALGTDASASGPGQEDNEPTGVPVSNGSSKPSELLETSAALAGQPRGFFAQQHGDNVVYEFFRITGQKQAGK